MGIYSRIGAFYRKYPKVANAITGFGIFSSGDILSQIIPQVDHNTKLIFDNNRFKIINKNNDFIIDMKRAMSYGILGSVMNGIVLTGWYKMLDVSFGSSMISKYGICSKMIADQLIYAPLSIGIYFSYTIMLAKNKEEIYQTNCDQSAYHPQTVTMDMVQELNNNPNIPSEMIKIPQSTVRNNQLFNQIVSKIEIDMLPTWAADCCVWPFANYINFRYIPLPFRPTFVGLIQICWQSYLSYRSHR